MTRPAEKVALEVHRKLVTVEGAAKNYGVVVDPVTFAVNEEETVSLRAKITSERVVTNTSIYNRGGSLDELRAKSVEETGLPAPVPQWHQDPYGSHVQLQSVRDWYKLRRAEGDWKLE